MCFSRSDTQLSDASARVRRDRQAGAPDGDGESCGDNNGGDLQVYDARKVQIAGGGAAQQGPNRPCPRIAVARVRMRRCT